MYNFALAFVICCVVYLIGEIVSNLTKAWIPSVFVTAAVLLIGYWCGLPKEVITDSKLLPFGSTIGMYLLLVHWQSSGRPSWSASPVLPVCAPCLS